MGKQGHMSVSVNMGNVKIRNSSVSVNAKNWDDGYSKCARHCGKSFIVLKLRAGIGKFPEWLLFCWQ